MFASAHIWAELITCFFTDAKVLASAHRWPELVAGCSFVTDHHIGMASQLNVLNKVIQNKAQEFTNLQEVRTLPGS